MSRCTELEKEIGNLADAVAAGLLKSSPELAKRLARAKSELERLRAIQPARVVKLLPRVDERFRELVADLPEALATDPERARVIVGRLMGGDPSGDGGSCGEVHHHHGPDRGAFIRMAVGDCRHVKSQD
jgi:hypothetical protein